MPMLRAAGCVYAGGRARAAVSGGWRAPRRASTRDPGYGSARERECREQERERPPLTVKQLCM